MRVLYSDESRGGQLGGGDSHDRICCGDGIGSPGVGRVVDPTVAKSDITGMLARVPVISSSPDIVLSTVDPPDDPPVAGKVLEAGHLLHRVSLTCKAVSVRWKVWETAIVSHTLKQGLELLVAGAEGHLTLVLAVGLIRQPAAVNHALQYFIADRIEITGPGGYSTMKGEAESRVCLFFVLMVLLCQGASEDRFSRRNQPHQRAR